MTYLPTISAAPWTDRAMCGGGDSAMWELTGETDNPAKLEPENLRAIEICGMCPVIKECLEEALKFGDRGVIRAGVPMWGPMELFRCKCGRRGLRSRRTEKQKRMCDTCRVEYAGAVGRAGQRRQLAVA